MPAVQSSRTEMSRKRANESLLRLGALKDLIVRLRFTLIFLLAMILANAAAGTLSGELPPDVLATWGIGQQSVWGGDLSRLVTGTFLSHDLDMLIRQFVFAAVVVGYTEWLWGSWRAALLFVGLDICATLLLLTAVWALPAMSDVAALNDVGMSMGGFGLIGLAIAGQRGRFALLLIALLAISAKIALDFELLPDTGHLLALALGFFTGLALHWPSRAR